MAGAFNECFSSSGRAHVSSTTTPTIKNDTDHKLLASSENAVHHGTSEAAAGSLGLGPVQNNAAPGSSSVNSRQTTAGHYPNPSAPMNGNSAPLSHHHHNSHHHQHHHHIRIRQFENATTQFTGHDRTGVVGGRKGNVDALAAGDVHAGSGGLPLPLPAEHHHPTTVAVQVQPICKQGGIRYHAVDVARAYDTPSSLGLTEVVGLS